jgi:raffinose/stachyose/melibiose transport system substrate-binding protein
VRTAGGDYLERLKSGSLKFTDPSILKAVNVIYELGRMNAFNSDFTSIDFLQARQLYYDKKVAMYGEMVAFAQVQNQQWPEDLKTITAMDFFPAFAEEENINGNVAAPVSCGWGMAFNSKLKGDKLIAARIFANEVLGDEYNKVLVENAGIAVRNIADADVSKIPQAVIFYNENIAPRIIGGGHIDNRMPGGVVDVTAASLQEMILGMKTPQQALQDMQNALDKVEVL